MTAASSSAPGGAPQPRIKVALVTNIPAPYRVPVYNLIHQGAAVELTVFYAASMEPDRRWDLLDFAHRHVVLGGRMLTRAGRYIHYNPRIWRALVELAPDVVVTTGYNPTHLLAFAYTRCYGCAHVPQTDGTIEFEQALSCMHRLVRRVVIARSAAAVVASQGGWRLMRHYGMPASRIHFSPLCANTGVSWQRSDDAVRDIDFLFSARLVPNKRADFAVQVALGVARRLGRRLRIVLLGDGPMAAELEAQAETLRAELDVVLAGHVDQRELPGWFHRARLFLFPTMVDVWGVVANEAFMAEVPVIVSPHAGVADELVRDGRNGRVLPLDLDRWIDAATAILSDDPLRARWGRHGADTVAQYSFANAAAGLVDAAVQASGVQGEPRLSRFVRRPRVVCVRRSVMAVQVPLFERLREALDLRGVEFVLAVEAGGLPADMHADAHADPGWERCCAATLPSRRLPATSRTWLRPGVWLQGADLLIVEPEAWLIFNLRLASRPAPDRIVRWAAPVAPNVLPEIEAERVANAIFATLSSAPSSSRKNTLPRPHRLPSLDAAPRRS